MNDPKKELERLEKELLAATVRDEKFERFYAEIYEEFGEKEPKEEEDYLKDILQEIPTLGEVGPNTYTDNSRRTAPVRQKENNTTLVLTICLESLGIVALVAWWVLRLI